MQALRDWLAQAHAAGRRAERPLVTLSYAQSLDGCLTVKRGQPTALSGPETRAMTHHLRAAHDAILVGVGTVLADDPQLNVRLVEGRDPRPVVLDTNLRTPEGCRLMAREHNLPWVVSGPGADPARVAALEAHGAKVLPVTTGADGRIDLNAALAALFARGVRSLMVEGGAGVITAFLHARLVDRAVVTIAPVWLGGLPAVEGEVSRRTDGAERLAPRLETGGSAQIGADVVVWGLVTEGQV